MGILIVDSLTSLAARSIKGRTGATFTIAFAYWIALLCARRMDDYAVTTPADSRSKQKVNLAIALAVVSDSKVWHIHFQFLGLSEYWCLTCLFGGPLPPGTMILVNFDFLILQSRYQYRLIIVADTGNSAFNGCLHSHYSWPDGQQSTVRVRNIIHSQTTCLKTDQQDTILWAGEHRLLKSQ